MINRSSVLRANFIRLQRGTPEKIVTLVEKSLCAGRNRSADGKIIEQSVEIVSRLEKSLRGW